MAFGNWPVASFRQRTVYKTEFDIFKQNTDIDLISLVSYEDQSPIHFRNGSVRPKTVPESKFRARQDTNEHIEKISARNRVKSAFHTDIGKYQPQEKETKRRRWTKSETSIYKDFARSSRKLLGIKHRETYQRKEQNIRDCRSALEVRNPSTEQGPRSQTTCGFHPNEGNWIKSRKINSEVSKVETSNKGVNITCQLNNKTDKSILNHILRTRSAQTRAQTNKRFSPKGQAPIQNDHLTKCESTYSKRPHSGFNESKSKEIIKTKRTCFDLTDSSQEQDALSNTFSPVRTDITGDEDDTAGVNDCNSTENENSGNKNLTEWIKQEHVQNETVPFAVEKECDNCDFDENWKETGVNSFTNLNEDGVCSKDSGFASNAVTPELDFWNKSFAEDSKEELNEENLKRVTFKIQSAKGGASFEHVETCSVISENENSVLLSDAICKTESKVSETSYDINDLICDLERIGTGSRLSVISTGGQSNFTIGGDTDSLSGEVAQTALDELRKAEEKEKAKLEEENKELYKPKDIESFIMSKEARHAIMETLQDMGTVKGKKRNKDLTADIRHKGVNAQRRQTDNRNKYEYYMRERTKSYYRNHFKSIDSVGNDENSSVNSSPRTAREFEETSSEDCARRKLFPAIRENSRLSKTTDKSNILTLDQAKKTKYKIPGIGNYHLIASPDNDFEITPPGFDSRYNPRPVITKEEMEIPPRFIRERSIQKCKSWLSNVNMSPMSLRPVNNQK